MANTAGGRSGRFATSVKNEIRRVWCEQRRDERQHVKKEARLVNRMVLDRNQAEAALVGDPCEAADAGEDRVGNGRQAGDHALQDAA